MESRVFSGMGIPEIMFGRGNTANRSTGDNMTSEMADRIRAISKVIETFFNAFIIKEILMEGGYDPVLNPDQAVEFRFNDNDVDVEIKKQVHAIYKYEHNAITEDEMREELGMDPIADSEREKLFVELITRETLRVQAELDTQVASATSSETGTKETNNKSKNGGGKPKGSSSSKSKSAIEPHTIGLVKDSIDNMEDSIDNYIKMCYDANRQILQSDIMKKIVDCSKEILYTIGKGSNVDISPFQDQVIALSTKMTNQIHDDLSGTNVYQTDLANVLDTIDMRMEVFKDSILAYITKYQSTPIIETVLIERGT
jgi:hypothetical protein